MKCGDFQTRLQQFLDGDFPVHEESTLLVHAKDCRSCGELHAAAHRLAEGLRIQPMYLPPPGFADRVVARALATAEPHHHVRPWLALAASVLFAGFALWTASFWFGGKQEIASVQPSDGQNRFLALTTQLDEVVPATLETTKRVVQGTVNTASALVPPVERFRLPELPVPMEVAWTPLREMGETVAIAIEPVAYSAQQTWNAMWNGRPEMPSR